jgi:NitT/TauT family transport system permease protein
MSAVTPRVAAADQSSFIFTLLGWIVAVLLLAGLLAIWWLYSLRPGPRVFVPPPPEVFAALAALFDAPAFWRAAGGTVMSWLSGFVPAAVIGVALGLLIGRSRAAYAIAKPAITVFTAFPVPGLTLLAIVWYGLTGGSHAVITGALLAFFSIAAIAAHGQGAPDAARRWRAVFRALEIGTILALAGVIVAEFVASNDRLGALLLAANATLNMAQLFALILALWLLGLLLALPFTVGRCLSRFS